MSTPPRDHLRDIEWEESWKTITPIPRSPTVAFTFDKDKITRRLKEIQEEDAEKAAILERYGVKMVRVEEFTAGGEWVMVPMEPEIPKPAPHPWVRSPYNLRVRLPPKK